MIKKINKPSISIDEIINNIENEVEKSKVASISTIKKTLLPFMLAGVLLTTSGNLEIKNNSLEIKKEHKYTFDEINKIDLVIKSVHTDINQISQISNFDLIDFDDLLIEKEIISPDYWMIITKDCDLSFDDPSIKKTRNENISIFPIFDFILFKKLLIRKNINFFEKINSKIIINAIFIISKVLPLISANKIDNLIKNNISRFMYLPPDGEILKEPMLIDFDITHQLDGGIEEEVNKVLISKLLQLKAPFKHIIAQRFALHYSSIGLEDKFIRDKSYIKNIKELFKS